MTTTIRRWAATVPVVTAAVALAAPAASAAAPAPDAQAAVVKSASAPLSPVSTLDVDRYLGEWYQVAAIPQLYTAQCAAGDKATYGRVDADSISVRNSCRTWTRKTSEVTGQADVLDTRTNAQLRVTFNEVPSFGDQARPNYVVAYLASDYSLALVGDPDRRSGFVLSRTPNVTAEQWSVIKQAVTDNGYQQWRFITTVQEGGERFRKPLPAVK